MFDVCTTWTLFPIADYGFWSTMGTTRSLVCTYVKPVLEGEVVDVECRVSFFFCFFFFFFFSFYFSFYFVFFSCLFLAFLSAISVGMANRWYLMLTWFRTCFLGGVFKIVHAGKRLCLLTGIMKREKDGAIVATCEHNKYNIDADESKM